MTHIEQKAKQFRDNFEKVLNKKTIYKADILSLKKQAKVLSELNSEYRKLFNSITTHVNAMKGILIYERKQKLQKLFETTFQNT